MQVQLGQLASAGRSRVSSDPDRIPLLDLGDDASTSDDHRPHTMARSPSSPLYPPVGLPMLTTSILCQHPQP